MAYTRKPRLRFYRGMWWCRNMYATGCGHTMEEAWQDMWFLAKSFIKTPEPKTWDEFYNRDRVPKQG